MGGKRYFMVRQVIYQPKNLTVYPDVRTEDFSFVLMWSQRYCRENFLMSFLTGSARISFFDYENSYVKALKFSVKINFIYIKNSIQTVLIVLKLFIKILIEF